MAAACLPVLNAGVFAEGVVGAGIDVPRFNADGFGPALRQVKSVGVSGSVAPVWGRQEVVCRTLHTLTSSGLSGPMTSMLWTQDSLVPKGSLEAGYVGITALHARMAWMQAMRGPCSGSIRALSQQCPPAQGCCSPAAAACKHQLPHSSKPAGP